MNKNIFKLAMLVTFILLAGTLSFAVKDIKAPLSKERGTAVAEKVKEPKVKEEPKPKTEIIKPQQTPVEDKKTPEEINPFQPPEIQLSPAPIAKTAGYLLKRKVLSAGGINGSSASYKLKGTVAENFAGKGSSASYKLQYGYWAGPVTTFIRGDANGDGVINSADIVYLINYQFVGGPPPVPLAAGDANCDGKVDSADIVYLINYQFIGGPPPSC